MLRPGAGWPIWTRSRSRSGLTVGGVERAAPECPPVAGRVREPASTRTPVDRLARLLQRATPAHVAAGRIRSHRRVNEGFSAWFWGSRRCSSGGNTDFDREQLRRPRPQFVRSWAEASIGRTSEGRTRLSTWPATRHGSPDGRRGCSWRHSDLCDGMPAIAAIPRLNPATCAPCRASERHLTACLSGIGRDMNAVSARMAKARLVFTARAPDAFPGPAKMAGLV